MISRRLVRVAAALAVALAVAGLGAGGASAADSPTAPATAAPSTAAIVPNPSVAKPGAQIKVTGSGWPKSIAIQVALCGNFANNGTSDCYSAGAGSSATDANGNFTAFMRAGTPPKPCPCVVYANSFATPITVRQPFTLTGASEAATTKDTSARSLDVSMRLTGSNLGAWFGGPAKRELVMSVKNTGTTALIDPPVTLTAGRGSDPTDYLAQPKIGTIQPNQTIVYKLPVKFAAPAIGQYKVKAQFTGLDTLVEKTASTSSYPWALIILGWLLLQPVLLGLYKRRPVLEDDESEDPFAPRPDAPSPAPVPAYAGVAEDPLLGGGFPAPVYAAAGAALVPQTTRDLVPNYRPVFGVTDLRSYLDPANQGPRPHVVPRIVVGGVVPRTAPLNGSTPPPPAP